MNDLEWEGLRGVGRGLSAGGIVVGYGVGIVGSVGGKKGYEESK